MKVYYEVLPDTLGRAMYRINKYLKQFAPPSVQFTTDYSNADLQILDSIGIGSMNFIRNNKYILLQHCFLSTETIDPDFWIPKFKNALFVQSYYDLPVVTGNYEFNFLRLPWGVDENIFYKKYTANKEYQFMTTGYVSETECIFEAYSAAKAYRKEIAHVGHNFSFGSGYHHFEGISDESMNDLYNRSFYTIGLRRIEGFELPVIEGLMCNSRPICFNTSSYSYWFEDLVEYIDEEDSGHVLESLKNIVAKPYRPVTDCEIDYVKQKFSWRTIANNFWKKVEESL